MEALTSKKLLYRYRVFDKGTTEAAHKIAFTTENSRSMSKDVESTATKDGNIKTPGSTDVSISCTSIFPENDDFVDTLEDALDQAKLMEIWEVDLSKPVPSKTGKFYGNYYQGYLSSLEKTSNADGKVELSLEFEINGAGLRHQEVTASSDEVEEAMYVYRDTTQVSA